MGTPFLFVHPVRCAGNRARSGNHISVQARHAPATPIESRIQIA
jgi:hypothetical protein